MMNTEELHVANAYAKIGFSKLKEKELYYQNSHLIKSDSTQCNNDEYEKIMEIIKNEGLDYQCGYQPGLFDDIDEKYIIKHSNSDPYKNEFDISSMDVHEIMDILEDFGYKCKITACRMACKIKKMRIRKINPLKLLQIVSNKPDIFLRELAKIFKCSVAAVHKMLKKLLFTNKVKQTEYELSDPQKRIKFLRLLERYKRKGYAVVYVDESGFRVYSERRRGWSHRGVSCKGKSKSNYHNDTNVIGALNGKKLVAAGVYTSPINSKIFLQWVTEYLLPELNEKSVIVMDNASFHKTRDVQEVINKAGHALLYLPPYTPQYNPIEKLWGSAKKLRNAYGFPVYELFEALLQYPGIKDMNNRLKNISEPFDMSRYINTFEHFHSTAEYLSKIVNLEEIVPGPNLPSILLC